MVIAVGLLIMARKPIATHIVDARLDAMGVPYSYTITGLSPWRQTIDNVRLGDPRHPDLVARRILLGWRWRGGWPELRAIGAEGAQLEGRWQQGRLSLGVLDRFLPRTGNGGPALPDLDARFVDSAITLLTPAGVVRAAIAGQGNLADGFRGRLALAAPALAVGGCAIEGLRADVAIGSQARSPLIKGPIALDRAICPTRTLALGAGRATVDVRLASDLAGVSGQVQPEGFAGHQGAIAFGALGGTLAGRIGQDGGGGDADLRLASIATAGAKATGARVNGAWRLGKDGPGYEGDVHLAALSAPAGWAQRAAGVGQAAAGTPVGPIAARLSALAADLATRSRIEAGVTFGAAGLRIEGATARGRTGAVTLAGRYAPNAQGGWQADAEIAEVTSALPPITIHAGRKTASAPLAARIEAAPFVAPDARLVLAPMTISGNRFATAATIDGPLASGRIEGLHAPIAGRFGSAGVWIGEGCAPVSFQHVVLGSIDLDPAGFSLCGAPLFANGHIAAEARGVRLTGHSGSAPLGFDAASLGWADGVIHGQKIAARLGAADDPTRLDLAAIDGTATADGFAGHFEGADGAIGHVPLAMTGGAGGWRFGQGALHLAGALTAADRDPTPRFKPMATRDVTLTLVDGRIAGTASLQPLGRSELVANVSLHHDLASGVGHATLDVPGIVFARRGLQPEMLTPLTLGVVANAVGTVAGQGRIDWTPRATRSSGEFHTDRLDLAAAFGPVTGIATSIRFTDLLGMVSAPHQEARIAAVNPGVIVADGVVHFQLLPGSEVAVEDARWPFAGGTLTLAPGLLDFSHPTDRHLTFAINGLDAATFVQQLDFPNLAATGTFDGQLPMVFDADGGRIAGGTLTARGPGTLAYVGELSNAQIGTMGKLAFNALKAIRYSALKISLDGRLDGEIISKVQFEGVRQAAGDKGLVARALHNLPFRFNISIRAPFRGLLGSARAYADPELLLQTAHGLTVAPVPVQAPVHSGASATKR